MALGALLVAATRRRAARRERRAEADFPPLGRIVTVDGRRVHAVTRGEGPDLVLIHGASGNCRDMTWALMGRLADRYRVTAFDRPGLGYTDRARDGLSLLSREAESPAEQAALLRAAARAMGIERPIVLGHSFGGAVALAWALDDPEGVAAVVDVAGVSMPWTQRLGWLYRINASRLGGALVPLLISAWVPRRAVERAIEATFAPHPVPEGYGAHLGAELTARSRSLRANARQVGALRPHVIAMSGRYGEIPVPVEIVHGDSDPTVPLDVHSARLAPLLPQANLAVIPGGGHMPHHTHPDAVVAAVDRARARAGL